MEENKVEPRSGNNGTAAISRLHYPPTIDVLAAAKGKATDWEQAARTVAKNWEAGAVFALIVALIVTLLAFKLKNRYESIARLEVDPPSSGVLSLPDFQGLRPSDQDYIQTQVQILQGDELAIMTIRSLGLDQDPEFVGNRLPTPPPFRSAGLTSGGIQLTRREGMALKYFRQHLRVTQDLNSRMVEVSFSSTNPVVAANVVNTLANFFVEQNFRTHYQATMQASEWLQRQMSDLRQKVEESKAKLIEYQRDNGIAGAADKGGNTAVQSLADLNHQLVQAQAARIQFEAYLKMAERGAISSLPQVRDDTTLQKLDEGLTRARADLAEAVVIYGSNHPRVRQLENEINEFKAQIFAEQQTIVENLKTSSAAAEDQEQLLSQALGRMKRIVSGLDEKMIQYNVLKNEAQADADLYDALLRRLKEAEISAGLKSSNIRIVDPGRMLNKPSAPNRPLIVAMGALVGILGGLGFAFGKEYLDNSIRTPDDVKELTGLASLAVVPLERPANGRARLSEMSASMKALLGNGNSDRSTAAARGLFLLTPNSPSAEGIRSLYTSIMLSCPGRPPGSILVASALPGEGKTTLSVNLAALLAQHGKTCLVEGDLRRPVLRKYLDLNAAKGLTHVLTGSAELESALLPVQAFSNLNILAAGQIPPNPGDLISSDEMKQVLQSLSAKFKFVVIDSAPLIPFSDARTIATMADGVVLVGRFAVTTRQSVVRSVELLSQVQARILGVVLNGVELGSADYKYYYLGGRYGRGLTHAYQAYPAPHESRSSS